MRNEKLEMETEMEMEMVVIVLSFCSGLLVPDSMAIILTVWIL